MSDLRETVAEAIKCKVDPNFCAGGPSDRVRNISKVALNALRDAGLVVVRRDDLETVLEGWWTPKFPECLHPVNDRLRAAVQEGAGDGE